MTANVRVQCRINKEVKEEATTILATYGLTVSDALRLLLIMTVRERNLPFDSFIPNAETEAAMQEALDSKPGDYSRFDTVEEFMANLNAPD